MRTGRTETGTGMSAYYAQMIAEELKVRPETISLIMGDTDKTPDGGSSAGFLSGMPTFARSPPIPIRRCSGWPLRNSVFLSKVLPSLMVSCRAAERASVTDNLLRGSSSI